MSEQTQPVPVPSVVGAVVPAGLSTYFGMAVSLVSALAAAFAAVKGNDTATITSALSGVLVALGTIGGRMAQAIALARQVAVAVKPFTDALAALEAAQPAVKPALPQIATIETPVGGGARTARRGS